MMNWILSSTVLILVVISLRFLLKGKISLRLQYMLWTFVLIRLLVPFSIGETVISVETKVVELSEKKELQEFSQMAQTGLSDKSYEEAYEEVAEKYIQQGIDIETIPKDEYVETIDSEITDTMTGKWSLVEIAKVVWEIGIIGIGGYFTYTNMRFHRKLMRSRKSFIYKSKLPVYISDEIETPCLFGLLHPAIYVTSEVLADERMLCHVIAHETTHYLHKDHIWGILRGLCLALHWYNPLVWYAAVLSRNDAELACDETTIQRLGESERASYGRTLIGLTCKKRTAVLLTSTTMTGSGKVIKERIELIVKKPKMAIYTLVTVVLIMMVAVLCTFTGAKSYAGVEKEGDSAQEGDQIKDEDDVDGATNIEHPIIFSAEEKELIANALLAATGVANVEDEVWVEDGWGGSSEEISDYDKSVFYHFLMDKYNFTGLDSFEEAGLLEESLLEEVGNSDAYKVNAEQYIAAIDFMFQDGFKDESKAMDLYIDSNDELRVPVDENGIYEIFACFETVYGEVNNLIIMQVSETSFVIDADVKSNLNLLGGIFNVHMEAELNPDSPFAGITITSLETMCRYRIDYVEIEKEERRRNFEETYRIISFKL